MQNVHAGASPATDGSRQYVILPLQFKMSIFFDMFSRGLLRFGLRVNPDHTRLGMRQGSMACTTGLAKRVADRVSCMASTDCPQRFACTRERA